MLNRGVIGEVVKKILENGKKSEQSKKRPENKKKSKKKSKNQDFSISDTFFRGLK